VNKIKQGKVKRSRQEETHVWVEGGDPCFHSTFNEMFPSLHETLPKQTERKRERYGKECVSG
jgi:hypothetical protein